MATKKYRHGPTAKKPKTATKLFALREDRGITRQEVVDATGVPYTTLTRLEHGSSETVNLRYVNILANYYGQPLDVRHLLGI